MPPRSLSEICIRKCIKNLNYLNCVGDLTYEAVRPILLKITSADQLREIEVLSPQLQGEDAEIWQKLIAKDFPGWEKKNYYPKNPLSWYLVYRKYKVEQEAEMKAAEAKLVSAFATLEEKKQSHTSKIVDQRLLPKPPGRRGPRSTRGGGGGGGALGGSSFLKKARREAREHASRIRSTPTGALAVRPGQIKKAPEAMVNDYRIASQKDIRIRVPRLSKPKRDLELEAREARLMAAKGRAMNKTGADMVHLLSDEDVDEHEATSDLDNSLDEKPSKEPNLDDLFSDEELQATAPKTTARHFEKASVSPQKKAAASPTPKQEHTTSVAGHKPRTGLLSNAYKGTAERPHFRQPTREPQKLSPSPVKQLPARSSPQAKPQPSPERKTDARQAAASSAGSPTSEASPPAARISPPASPKEGPVIYRKRRAPVDIFMPKKTQRH